MSYFYVEILLRWGWCKMPHVVSVSWVRMIVPDGYVYVPIHLSGVPM